MPTNVTFDGTAYSLPDVNETGWGDTVTNFLVDVASNAVTINNAQTLNGKTLQSAAGSAAAPTVTFANDTSTGMYLNAVGSLGFAVAGVKNFIMDNTGDLIMTGGTNNLTFSPASTGNPPSITATGTDTNIGISFVPKGSGVINFGSMEVTGNTALGDVTLSGSLTAAGSLSAVGGIQDTPIGSSTASTGIFTTATASTVQQSIGASNYALSPFNGYRNRLINPFCSIDQANEGASVSLATGTPAYVADGWLAAFSHSGATCSVQTVTDAPTSLPSSRSIKFTNTTGISVGTNDYAALYQPIEGYNITDLAFGTSAAQAVSAQFWIKTSLSSATFTFFIWGQNSGIKRTYLANFTVASANTWTQITIPNIAGDGTSGSGGYSPESNSTGIYVGVTFTAGSSWQGTNDAWQSNQYFGTSSTTNLLATSSATVELTGIQFEVGSVCTPLERRSFQTELAMCQRYYEKSYDLGTAVGSTTVGDGLANIITASSTVVWSERWKATKRIDPTVVPYSYENGQSGTLYDNTSASNLSATCTGGMSSYFIVATGSSSGHNCTWHWTADARM